MTGHGQREQGIGGATILLTCRGRRPEGGADGDEHQLHDEAVHLGTQEAEELAGEDLEGDVLDADVVPVVLGQRLQRAGGGHTRIVGPRQGTHNALVIKQALPESGPEAVEDEGGQQRPVAEGQQ